MAMNALFEVYKKPILFIANEIEGRHNLQSNFLILVFKAYLKLLDKDKAYKEAVDELQRVKKYKIQIGPEPTNLILLNVRAHKGQTM